MPESLGNVLEFFYAPMETVWRHCQEWRECW